MAMFASASLAPPCVVASLLCGTKRSAVAALNRSNLPLLQPRLSRLSIGCIFSFPLALHKHPLWTPQRLFATRCCLAHSSASSTTTARKKRSAKQSKAEKPTVLRRSAKDNVREPADCQEESEHASSSTTGSETASHSGYAASTAPSVAQEMSSAFDDKDSKNGVPVLRSDSIPDSKKKMEVSGVSLDEEDEGFFFGTTAVKRTAVKAVVAEMDLSILDEAEAMMKIPNINIYDLHTLDTVSEDIVSSLKGRRIMYRFVSHEERVRISRVIYLKQNEFKGRFIGASLYFRIVHPYDVAASAMNDDHYTRDSNPHDVEECSSSAVSKPLLLSAAQQQIYQQEVKKIRDGIERVLRLYVNRLIEPFPNELAIDLTHYRTFLALLNVSRRNVEQFLKDAEDYIAQRPVNRNGIPGGPPPPEDLEPISPDVLAAEIARLIRREVLQPLWGSKDVRHEHLNGDAAACAKIACAYAPRVCIGVASSPVLAKIACDAEVTAILKRLKDAKENQSCDTANRRGAAEAPLISVRSLYRHTSSLKAMRELVSTLPLAQVPLFPPAFVKLLREVFDVHTCGDLYTRQKTLCFCLSPKTFHLCYSVACGCMKFPIEETIALVAMSNLYRSCGAVRFLSSNVISIVNAERTKFASSFENFTRDTFTSSFRQIMLSSVVYGRLTPDDELVQSVLNAVSKAYTRMHHDGVTCGGLRCAILEGMSTTFAFDITYELFLSRHEVLKAVKAQLGPLLQHRKRGGIDTEGLFFSLNLSYVRVTPIAMIPPPMMEEAEELKEAVLHMKNRINHCSWVAEERKRVKKAVNEKLGLQPLRRRSSHKQGTSHGELNVDDVVVL